MKKTLPDVNLLLALLNPQHPFRPAAVQWFENHVQEAGLLLIPFEVASACVRLAANPHISAKPASPSETHAAVDRFLLLSGVRFLAPSEASWAVFGDLVVRLRGYRTVSDAHLAALAIANDCRLVTFDRDFLSFERLDVELLLA